MHTVPMAESRNFDFNFFISHFPHLEPHGEIWDTYAGSTLKGRESLFCSVHLHPPAHSQNPKLAGKASDEQTMSEAEAFTIYAVMVDGNAECIGEISNRSWAMRYAKAVAQHYGWEFIDLTTM
jgi:hypothetical protein